MLIGRAYSDANWGRGVVGVGVVVVGVVVGGFALLQWRVRGWDPIV